jgi:hypothetical protein
MFGIASRLRGQRHRSTVVVGNCDLGPITVVPHRAKAGLFERPSILFRPPPPATPGWLVEPPGTAPGSDPSIIGAFIAIVRVAPDKRNIGVLAQRRKRRRPRWERFDPGPILRHPDGRWAGGQVGRWAGGQGTGATRAGAAGGPKGRGTKAGPGGLSAAPGRAGPEPAPWNGTATPQGAAAPAGRQIWNGNAARQGAGESGRTAAFAAAGRPPRPPVFAGRDASAAVGGASPRAVAADRVALRSSLACRPIPPGARRRAGVWRGSVA